MGLLSFLEGSNPVSALVQNTVGKVVDKALDFIPDPQQKEAAREAVMKMQFDADAKALDAEVAQMQSVNATMQAELSNSKDENWWQKGWRPFNGYVVGAGSLFGVIATCGLLYQGIVNSNPVAIQAIAAVGISIAGILSIPGAAVGITAWHRGMMQREAQTGNGNDQ